MREKLQKQVSFLLRYLSGFVLLFWLLARIDRRQMMETLLQLHGGHVLLVLLIALISLFIQYRRWKFLIEQQSTDFKAVDLIPSFFAGFTFRLLLPGGHAEISKIFLLPGKKAGKVMAFAMEKFFQTYVKVILVLAGLPILFPPYRIYFLLLLIVVVAMYPMLPRVVQSRFFQRLREKDGNYHAIFFKTLLFSLSVFLCMIMQYFILLNDAYRIDFTSTMLTVIYLWGSGLVPVSISGLGIRENLAAILFNHYGIPAFMAVGISLFIFTINSIIPSLVGLYYIHRRRKYLADVGSTLRKASQQFVSRKKAISRAENTVGEE